MTTDQLVGRTAATVPQEPVARPDPVVYEYVSPRRLWGLPLAHIKLGRGRCRAKGILAIGNVATGILSIGMVSCGVVALGSVSLGVLALGAVAVGLCGALGGAAMGFFCYGRDRSGDCVLWRSGGGCIRDGRLRRRCAGCSWRNCKRTGCHWAYCFRRTDAAPPPQLVQRLRSVQSFCKNFRIPGSFSSAYFPGWRMKQSLSSDGYYPERNEAFRSSVP